MSSPQVRADAEQGMYVIKTSGGYSCFGFENCFRDSVALAQKLDRPDLMPTEDGFGTIEQYDNYRALIQAASKVNLGTWFTPGTPEPVQKLLEGYMKSQARVRILYGDPKTGMAWEDREMSGTIGRSGGIMKVPLLVKTSRSRGGEALLTDCIVRLRDAASGRTLYQHPDFHPRPQEPSEPEAKAPGPRM